MLFIDLKQGFDTTNRKKLFEAMDKMGIPYKLIKLIRITMCQTKARGKIDNQISAPLEFNKGVEQVDGLSTTAFILAQHNTVEEIDQRGTIDTKSSQIFAYADDVVIVTRSESRLRQVHRETEERTQQMGLIVNEGKTKYMIVSATRKGR
jgi:sorting nexin-29